MTQQEFNQLSALMPRKLFLQVTGLGPDDRYEMIRTGQLVVFRRPWLKHRARAKRRPSSRHYKFEAARLAGFKL